MQGIAGIWQALSPAKRVILIGAVAATVALLSLLARSASTPRMTLLFAGLESQAAGEVVAALDRLNVPYRVDGAAIYVPSTERDQARLALAGEGLPARGQAGYELLDGLSGFSTTSDMFDATYWRAKEGELARTILATPGVRAARVHIGVQNPGAFSRGGASPSAAITITTGAARIDPSQAAAIRYLVASAVPGLKPEQVAVIDSDRGVILSPGGAEEGAFAQEDAIDREQKLERDILDLLEARVGPGNARVQVSFDLDMDRETVSERVLNPDGRVLAGKETTEITESSRGSRGGQVTVASNLPEGDAAAPGQDQSSSRTETTETVTYDVSEVTRNREKAPGTIRKLSIAVLVNQIAAPAAEEGGEPVLRTPEELTTLRTLVARAAGLDEARGDSISIEALPFQTASTEGSLATASPILDFVKDHALQGVQFLILALVTLVIVLFVVKPLMAAKPAAAEGDAFAAGAPAIEFATAPEFAPSLGAPQADFTPSFEPPDPVSQLKEIASAKSDEAASLIKSWLESEEAAA